VAVLLGPSLVLGVVFAVLGARESQKFSQRYGRTPWGWPTGVWALLCFLSLVVGAILLFAARRTTAREVEAERASNQISAANSARADWVADPSGRHQLRYFDGTQWTEHVQDEGKYSKDPPIP
jgi:uncharacterized integral membrane protein